MNAQYHGHSTLIRFSNTRRREQNNSARLENSMDGLQHRAVIIDHVQGLSKNDGAEGVRGQVVPARKVGDDGGERVAGLDMEDVASRDSAAAEP